MTSGGTRAVAMDDRDAWTSSVDKLFPRIVTGDIELNGLRCGEPMARRLPSAELALVKVLPPVCDAIGDILLHSPSHISCCAFIDKEHWFRGFNDQLFEKGRAFAAWTHLQVRKDDLLSRWPKPEPTVKSQYDCRRWLIEQMAKSPDARPKSKSAFWDDAQKIFPLLARRQFNRAWDDAIDETDARGWSRAGAPKRPGRQSRTDGI
jgi:hypothetical protein